MIAFDLRVIASGVREIGASGVHDGGAGRQQDASDAPSRITRTRRCVRVGQQGLSGEGKDRLLRRRNEVPEEVGAIVIGPEDHTAFDSPHHHKWRVPWGSSRAYRGMPDPA